VLGSCGYLRAPIQAEQECLAGGLEEERVAASTSEDITTSYDYYMCRSTIFHSFQQIHSRKYVNAFLHVLIDQGIMAFPYVAVMMFVTGVVEGHWEELADEFKHDLFPNVHRLWIAALLGIAPIQVVAFRLLPLKWRALAVNLLDVFEVMVMSYITHRNREIPL